MTQNENHPQAVNASVHCPYCGRQMWTFRISGNEEQVERCPMPCRELFAIRWIEGQPFEAKIAWPMSELDRHAEIGARWQADNSLEEWFPISAEELTSTRALLDRATKAIDELRDKNAELQHIIDGLTNRNKN